MLNKIDRAQFLSKKVNFFTYAEITQILDEIDQNPVAERESAERAIVRSRARRVCDLVLKSVSPGRPVYITANEQQTLLHYLKADA